MSDAAAVTVQFLGSGDIFGSGGRFQTCIYVQSTPTNFLIDCGASALIAMRKFSVPPNTINTILLTHLHRDHFGGLPFFILDAQLFSRRQSALVVAGPPGVEDRVRQAMEIFFSGSADMPLRFPLEFVELYPSIPAEINHLTVTPFEVVHASGAPAYALRVTVQDKIIAYSGDTTWTDSLVSAAQGADLFICEAYCFEKRVKYHLDYQTLLAHRAELDCRRLVITHMHADLLQRLDEVELESAEDGKKFTL